MTAEILHEIRNPLVSIKTFVELLPERHEDPEYRERFVTVVRDEVRRIERLIDRVLEQAAPPTEGALASANLGPITAWAEELLSERLRERGVRLECALVGPLPRVALEEDALRQLLLNLLLNAVEASPAGGRVRLEAAAEGGQVVVHIRDEGAGVPESLRERIFEPFFSTRRPRSGGLGLAISRRMAEGAGGSLTVASSAAPGAAFRLVLPAEGGELPLQSPESSPAASHDAQARPSSARPVPKK